MSDGISRRAWLLASGTAAAGCLLSRSSTAQDVLTPAAQPVVVSTWTFGLPANELAFERLVAGADALDAVVEGVAVCETDPTVRTVGLGGYPNAEGVVQLDASVMHGPTRQCGAVAALEDIMTAAAVARRVMDQTNHILLAGADARAFAIAQGFEPQPLLTDEMRAIWEQHIAEESTSSGDSGELVPGGHDTIGMLAIDLAGTMSGACTTSGTPYKHPGRVGDSPIIGAGLFVDARVGGCTATGRGEEMMRTAGSFLVVELMKNGATPQEATAEACRRIVENYDDPETVPRCAYLALRVDGVVGACATWAGTFEYAKSDGTGHTMVSAPGVLGNE